PVCSTAQKSSSEQKCRRANERCQVRRGARRGAVAKAPAQTYPSSDRRFLSHLMRLFKREMGLARYITLLLLVCLTGYGSTFIVANQGDAIVVGTDSRVTVTIDYTRTQRGPDTCKIYKAGKGRYFVIAGTQFINIKTGIDFS